MKQLSSKVIKARSKELTVWFNEQNRNKDFVGKTVTAYLKNGKRVLIYENGMFKF